MKQSVKLIAGNWKMNGLSASLLEAKALQDSLNDSPVSVRVALCPPATLVAQMASTFKGGTVAVGGQDCHAEASGAFTGSIAAIPVFLIASVVTVADNGLAFTAIAEQAGPFYS